jgi:hypothetical protein
LRRGKSRARGDQICQQVLVLGRINPVMAARQHRDRAARKTGAMRRRIDAAGQAGGDGKPGLAEIARNRACKFQPGARRVARTDHGDDRPHQHIAYPAHAEQGWRIVKLR